MKHQDGKQRQPWTPDTDTQRAKNQISRAPASCRRVLAEFSRWLGEERGLCPVSITLRIGSARRFLAAISRGSSGSRALRRVTPRKVEDYFVSYCSDHGGGSRRAMQAALRLMLLFASQRGWVARDLVQAVPSLRTYRLSSTPHGLDDEALGRLVRSVADSRVSARDRTIVYLLTTYGVRGGQVSGLRLEDIDWPGRTITFRAHKVGKAVTHALTAAIAEALALYLREERPASNSAYVFLRTPAPYLQLSPPAVSQVVGARMRRLGIRGVPLGSHTLRHAFATRLLRAGQPFKAIADLLGHRSLSSTSIYAKVDLQRLLEVAIDWPEETL
jgi:integrase/recombinase XerD